MCSKDIHSAIYCGHTLWNGCDLKSVWKFKCEQSILVEWACCTGKRKEDSAIKSDS